MKIHVSLIALLTLFLLASGCSEPDGPAERAGENIDQAIDKSKDAVEEATDEAAKKIEEAGESMKN